jgi:hypothetical protein
MGCGGIGDCAGCENAMVCCGIGDCAALEDAMAALGIGIACGLPGMAGGTGGVMTCCSGTHRYPHLGQNLDLCGSASRQCGHNIEPQFLH